MSNSWEELAEQLVSAARDAGLESSPQSSDTINAQSIVKALVAEDLNPQLSALVSDPDIKRLAWTVFAYQSGACANSLSINLSDRPGMESALAIGSLVVDPDFLTEDRQSLVDADKDPASAGREWLRRLRRRHESNNATGMKAELIEFLLSQLPGASGRPLSNCSKCGVFAG